MHFFQKSIACYLIMSQLLMPLTWAQPIVTSGAKSSGEAASFLSGERIPELWGDVQAINKGRKSQTLFILQDAHSIPSAQKNIEKILTRLAASGAVSRIGLEGASGVIDARFYKTYPDAESRNELLDQWLSSGELSGAVAAAIRLESGVLMEGIENESRYSEGLLLYYLARRAEERALQKVERALKDLHEKKKKVYSPQLLRADDAVVHFFQGEMDLTALLMETSEVQMPEKGTRLQALLETLRQTDKERDVYRLARMLQAVKKRLEKITIHPVLSKERRMADLRAVNRMMQDLSTQNADPAPLAYELYRIAASWNIALRFPQWFRNRLVQFKKLQDIQGSDLYRELQQYLDHVMSPESPVSEKPDEDSLYAQTRFWLRLGALAKTELSHEDWQILKKSSVDENVFLPSWKFYENADQRDQVMGSHILKQMDRGESYAVVIGGFHSAALQRAVRDAGYSVVLIAPAMTGIPQSDIYRKQMDGQVSWKKYLNKDAGQKADPSEAFARAFRDAVQNTSRGSRVSLKEWRDRILMSLAADRELDRAGNYVRFIDEAAAVQAGLSALTMAWASNVRKFCEGLRSLDHQGKFSPSAAAALLPSNIIPVLGGPKLLIRGRMPWGILQEGAERSALLDRIDHQLVLSQVGRQTHREQEVTGALVSRRSDFRTTATQSSRWILAVIPRYGSRQGRGIYAMDALRFLTPPVAGFGMTSLESVSVRSRPGRDEERESRPAGPDLKGRSELRSGEIYKLSDHFFIIRKGILANLLRRLNLKQLVLGEEGLRQNPQVGGYFRAQQYPLRNDQKTLALILEEVFEGLSESQAMMILFEAATAASASALRPEEANLLIPILSGMWGQVQRDQIDFINWSRRFDSIFEGVRTVIEAAAAGRIVLSPFDGSRRDLELALQLMDRIKEPMRWELNEMTANFQQYQEDRNAPDFGGASRPKIKPGIPLTAETTAQLADDVILVPQRYLASDEATFESRLQTHIQDRAELAAYLKQKGIEPKTHSDMVIFLSSGKMAEATDHHILWALFEAAMLTQASLLHRDEWNAVVSLQTEETIQEQVGEYSLQRWSHYFVQRMAVYRLTLHTAIQKLRASKNPEMDTEIRKLELAMNAFPQMEGFFRMKFESLISAFGKYSRSDLRQEDRTSAVRETWVSRRSDLRSDSLVPVLWTAQTPAPGFRLRAWLENAQRSWPLLTESHIWRELRDPQAKRWIQGILQLPGDGDWKARVERDWKAKLGLIQKGQPVARAMIRLFLLNKHWAGSEFEEILAAMEPNIEPLLADLFYIILASDNNTIPHALSILGDADARAQAAIPIFIETLKSIYPGHVYRAIQGLGTLGAQAREDIKEMAANALLEIIRRRGNYYDDALKAYAKMQRENLQLSGYDEAMLALIMIEEMLNDRYFMLAMMDQREDHYPMMPVQMYFNRLKLGFKESGDRISKAPRVLSVGIEPKYMEQLEKQVLRGSPYDGYSFWKEALEEIRRIRDGKASIYLGQSDVETGSSLGLGHHAKTIYNILRSFENGRADVELIESKVGEYESAYDYRLVVRLEDEVRVTHFIHAVRDQLSHRRRVNPRHDFSEDELRAVARIYLKHLMIARPPKLNGVKHPQIADRDGRGPLDESRRKLLKGPRRSELRMAARWKNRVPSAKVESYSPDYWTVSARDADLLFSGVGGTQKPFTFEPAPAVQPAALLASLVKILGARKIKSVSFHPAESERSQKDLLLYLEDSSEVWVSYDGRIIEIPYGTWIQKLQAVLAKPESFETPTQSNPVPGLLYIPKGSGPSSSLAGPIQADRMYFLADIQNDGRTGVVFERFYRTISIHYVDLKAWHRSMHQSPSVSTLSIRDADARTALIQAGTAVLKNTGAPVVIKGGVNEVHSKPLRSRKRSLKDAVELQLTFTLARSLQYRDAVRAKEFRIKLPASLKGKYASILLVPEHEDAAKLLARHRPSSSYPISEEGYIERPLEFGHYFETHDVLSRVVILVTDLEGSYSQDAADEIKIIVKPARASAISRSELRLFEAARKAVAMVRPDLNSGSRRARLARLYPAMIRVGFADFAERLELVFQKEQTYETGILLLRAQKAAQDIRNLKNLSVIQFKFSRRDLALGAGIAGHSLQSLEQTAVLLAGASRHLAIEIVLPQGYHYKTGQRGEVQVRKEGRSYFFTRNDFHHNLNGHVPERIISSAPRLEKGLILDSSLFMNGSRLPLSDGTVAAEMLTTAVLSLMQPLDWLKEYYHDGLRRVIRVESHAALHDGITAIFNFLQAELSIQRSA